MQKIVMYSDGGSRGNPGPAALGVYIETLDKQFGEFLGIKTNNEAEYLAIVAGLKKIKAVVGKVKAKSIEIECRMDSELAVRQLTHQYKVEKEHIQKLCFLVWNLTHDFAKVSFIHVLREQNTIADAMANQAMDKAAQNQTLL